MEVPTYPKDILCDCLPRFPFQKTFDEISKERKEKSSKCHIKYPLNESIPPAHGWTADSPLGDPALHDFLLLPFIHIKLRFLILLDTAWPGGEEAFEVDVPVVWERKEQYANEYIPW